MQMLYGSEVPIPVGMNDRFTQLTLLCSRTARVLHNDGSAALHGGPPESPGIANNASECGPGKPPFTCRRRFHVPGVTTLRIET